MFPLAKLDRNTTADGLKKFIAEEEAKYVAFGKIFASAA